MGTRERPVHAARGEVPRHDLHVSQRVGGHALPLTLRRVRRRRRRRRARGQRGAPRARGRRRAFALGRDGPGDRSRRRRERARAGPAVLLLLLLLLLLVCVCHGRERAFPPAAARRDHRRVDHGPSRLRLERDVLVLRVALSRSRSRSRALRASSHELVHVLLDPSEDDRVDRGRRRARDADDLLRGRGAAVLPVRAQRPARLVGGGVMKMMRVRGGGRRRVLALRAAAREVGDVHRVVVGGVGVGVVRRGVAPRHRPRGGGASRAPDSSRRSASGTF
eukprot:31213-Pelagococcus_subviridis.AAC.3